MKFNNQWHEYKFKLNVWSILSIKLWVMLTGCIRLSLCIDEILCLDLRAIACDFAATLIVCTIWDADHISPNYSTTSISYFIGHLAYVFWTQAIRNTLCEFDSIQNNTLCDGVPQNPFQYKILHLGWVWLPIKFIGHRHHIQDLDIFYSVIEEDLLIYCT